MITDMEDKKAKLIERRRKEILAAARRIFAKNGYRRAKIDHVIVYLGVGKGTVYRYFKDKKALFLAVFEQGMNELRQTIRANVEPIVNPKDKVCAAIRTYFGFFENNRELIEILMQVRSEFKEDYRRVFLALYEDYIVKIQENLREGIKTGVFRELDVEGTADAISATLQGVLQGFYIRQFGGEKEKLPEAEKNIAAGTDYVKYEKARSGVGQRRELLTDRTGAVTALLLEGLLQRNSKETFQRT